MVAGMKGSASQRIDNRPLSEDGAGLVVHMGFSTKSGWLSRGIRRVTGSRASHCFIVYPCELFGQEMVLEASANGFRLISWRRWDRMNKLIALYRLNLPEGELRTGLRRLSNRLGDAFDRLSLLGFLLQRLFRLQRVPFNSRAKLVCSEAVALFLHWCGLPIPNVGVMTPELLLRLAESRADAFTRIDESPLFPRVARRIARRTRRQFATPSDPPLLG